MSSNPLPFRHFMLAETHEGPAVPVARDPDTHHTLFMNGQMHMTDCDHVRYYRNYHEGADLPTVEWGKPILQMGGESQRTIGIVFSSTRGMLIEDIFRIRFFGAPIAAQLIAFSPPDFFTDHFDLWSDPDDPA